MSSTYSDRLSDLTEPWWQTAAAAQPAGHRELMRLVAVAVALRVLRPSDADAERLRMALTLADDLAALQGPDGLFSSDGNLHSPPDSAFSLNDLGITLDMLERLSDPGLAPLQERLERIAALAVPALVEGGVHTPNHRWEISAALVRLAAFDPRALTRAQQWLAEGVDVDPDGLYSERSANYAALVSNPSLLAIADVLDRRDLVEIVHRNLHAHLALTDADGVVETVFSRRQDHSTAIPVEYFHTQLRRFALAGCATCRAVAQVSEPTSDRVAAAALLDVAAEPSLGADLADESTERAEIRRHFDGVGLLVRERAGVRSIVYGGSDVPHVGRVGSGLAANPTFVRFRSGAAIVRSVRLSRVFFGLGPFRASSFVVGDDGDAHLHERVAARYYQPLPASSLVPDGGYRLEDDGRFSASMAFGTRAAQEIELITDITARVDDDRVELDITTQGVDTRWSLELALGEGELTGVEQVGDETYRMTGRRAELRNGSDAVVIETSLDPEPDPPGFYSPGEAYSFLGGTDALNGRRLYLAGTTPSTWTLTLRSA